jgi:hypothetical protein
MISSETVTGLDGYSYEDRPVTSAALPDVAHKPSIQKNIRILRRDAQREAALKKSVAICVICGSPPVPCGVGYNYPIANTS